MQRKKYVDTATPLIPIETETLISVIPGPHIKLKLGYDNMCHETTS